MVELHPEVCARSLAFASEHALAEPTYVRISKACMEGGSVDDVDIPLAQIVGDRCTPYRRNVIRNATCDAYRSGRSDLVSTFIRRAELSVHNACPISRYILELFRSDIMAACDSGFMMGFLILMRAAALTGIAPRLLRFDNNRLLHSTYTNDRCDMRAILLSTDTDVGGSLTDADHVEALSHRFQQYVWRHNDT